MVVLTGARDLRSAKANRAGRQKQPAARHVFLDRRMIPPATSNNEAHEGDKPRIGSNRIEVGFIVNQNAECRIECESAREVT